MNNLTIKKVAIRVALLFCIAIALLLVSCKKDFLLISHTNYDVSFFPEAAVIQNDFMYVAHHKHISIIDLRSQLEFPMLANYDIDTLEPGAGSVHDISVRGKYIYLVTDKGLLTLDVSDRLSPIVTSIFDFPERPGDKDVKIHRNYLYAVFRAGVLIFDLTDPASPSYLTRMQMASGRPEEIAFSGDYAFVAVQQTGNTQADYLEIWDIESPSAPRRLLEYTGRRDAVNGIVIQGSYAYLGRDWTRLDILDINDPLMLKEVGSVSAKGPIEEFIVDGDYAYFANTSSLTVVNVANPKSPRLVGRHSFGNASTIDKIGESIFVTGYGVGKDMDRGVYKFRIDSKSIGILHELTDWVRSIVG